MTIELVHDNAWILDTVDGCNNVGPACYGCPAFDSCDAHDDEDL